MGTAGTGVEEEAGGMEVGGTGVGAGRTEVDAGIGIGVEDTVADVEGAIIREAAVGTAVLGGTATFAGGSAVSFSFPFPFSFALAFPRSAGVAVPVLSPASVFRLLVAPPPAPPSGRRVRVVAVEGMDLSDGRRTDFAVGFFCQ